MSVHACAHACDFYYATFKNRIHPLTYNFRLSFTLYPSIALEFSVISTAPKNAWTKLSMLGKPIISY